MAPTVKDSSLKKKTLKAAAETRLLKKRRVFFTYSEKSIDKALKEINNKTRGIREACRIYGVPRTTVQDRLSGRTSGNKNRKTGPNPYLSTEGEKKIVNWVINMAKCGFPIQKSDLINCVADILKDTNIKTPFNNGKPGDTWYKAFLRRHPEISIREAEGINNARAAVTEERIRCWFKDLRDYLRSINALDVLEDPDRILNGDETGFSLCPKTGKVLAPRGFKNLYVIKKSNEKENITVLIVFTASGMICPPLVVFPYIRPPKAVVDSMPESWVLGRSESGWMRSDIFYEYISNEFNKWLCDSSIEKPVILFIDGHKSHMTLSLSEFCEEKGIILYALPANTTHILQPADVSVFKPLKQEWKKTVKERQSRDENLNQVVTKTNFCKIFKDTMTADLTVAIKNGFRKCGLYPYDEDAVDYTKCVKNTQRRVRMSDTEKRTNPKDYDTALKIISSLRKQITDQGIDIDIIMREIENAKINFLAKRRSQSKTPRSSAASVATPISNNQLVNTMSDTVNISLPELGSYVSLSNISLMSLDEINITSIDPVNVTEETDITKQLVVISQVQTTADHRSAIIENVNTDGILDVNCGIHNLGDPENLLPFDKNLNEMISTTDLQVPPEPPTFVSDSLEAPVTSDMRVTPADFEVTITSHRPFSSTLDTSIQALAADAIIDNQLTAAAEKSYRSVEDVFDKHLSFPEQPASKKRSSLKLPSAIACSAWRDYYYKKNEEKENKVKIQEQKRKLKAETKLEKEKIKKTKKKRLLQKPATKTKLQCSLCDEDLISDVEEDSEKNIGCDKCVRWYHLKCTSFKNKSYTDAAKSDYICSFCVIAETARADVLSEINL